MDPRAYQTYAYPGWELINTDTYSQGGGIYKQRLQKNFTGYHQIKGFVNNTDQTFQNGVDFPSIRYAEPLLIFAEAKAEIGELKSKFLLIVILSILAAEIIFIIVNFGKECVTIGD